MHQQVACVSETNWVEFNHPSKLYFQIEIFYEQYWLRIRKKANWHPRVCEIEREIAKASKKRETFLPNVLLFLCVPKIWSMLYKPFGFDWISLCDRILNVMWEFIGCSKSQFSFGSPRDVIWTNWLIIKV